MAFDPDLLDEIRTRITLSDLVGRTLALRRQGREFTALSPFNKEKSPSFFVNDDKRFYHCFSSGKSGDIFTWLMETEGVSFPEAVERLAGEAGVKLPENDPRAARQVQERKSLRHWLDEALLFFQRELDSVRGEEARAYLGRRGLPPEDWPRFEIGYAPESWSALKDHLVQRGAKPEELVRAGLLASSDRGKAPFDYFRNRIMFAIRDPQKRLVGFGGRALNPNDRAKYLNSPESELFDKGRILYRYPEARATLASARGEDAPKGLIVAEGYMDVIALARAGFAHAVAPLGTALTHDQLELLWKAGPEPILCFDGDAAGRRAAHRVIDRALPGLKPGRTLRFAHLPAGQDPDDIASKGGSDALAKVLGGARSLADEVWEREASKGPLETPEARADLKKRLRAVCAAIEDNDVGQQYKLVLLDRFSADFGWRPSGGRTQKSDHGASGRGGLAVTQRRRGVMRRKLERDAGRVFAALLDDPSLLDGAAERLAGLDFAEDDLSQLRDALVDLSMRDPGIDKEDILTQLDQFGVGGVAARVRGLRDFADADGTEPEAADDAALACWMSLAEAYELAYEASIEIRVHKRVSRAASEVRVGGSETEASVAGDVVTYREQMTETADAALKRVVRRKHSSGRAPTRERDGEG